MVAKISARQNCRSTCSDSSKMKAGLEEHEVSPVWRQSVRLG